MVCLWRIIKQSLLRIRVFWTIFLHKKQFRTFMMDTIWHICISQYRSKCLLCGIDF